MAIEQCCYNYANPPKKSDDFYTFSFFYIHLALVLHPLLDDNSLFHLCVRVVVLHDPNVASAAVATIVAHSTCIFQLLIANTIVCVLEVLFFQKIASLSSTPHTHTLMRFRFISLFRAYFSSTHLVCSSV